MKSLVLRRERIIEAQTRKTLLVLLSTTFLAAVADSALAQAVIIERAMPAPMVETIPVAPVATFKWVPGHWVWGRGQWVWMKGHYVENILVPAMPAAIVEVRPPPPSPQHVWVRGHYGWEGNRWSWHQGTWYRP